MRRLRSGAPPRQPSLHRDDFLDQENIREDVRAAVDACRLLPHAAYPGRDIAGVADEFEAIAVQLLVAALDDPGDPDAATVPPVLRAACVGPLRGIAEGRVLLSAARKEAR